MIPNTGSTGIVPAVNQVLDEINRNVSLLPDHRLDYILREIEVCMLYVLHACFDAVLLHIVHIWISIIQCNGPVALKTFFDVTTDRSVMAVVGCGCSSATEEVAKISHYLNISVVRIIEKYILKKYRSTYRACRSRTPVRQWCSTTDQYIKACIEQFHQMISLCQLWLLSCFSIVGHNYLCSPKCNHNFLR